MTTLALKEGYLRRMGVYLKEMYPIPARLVGAILLYAGVTVALQRIHGLIPDVVNAWSFVGVFSVFSLLLILRIMDEFKDREIDARLFRHRPLPSGRVLASDLKVTLVLLCASYVLVNAWSGPAFWTALFALGYAWLMFRFFFVPDAMKRSLPLALATHNPIVAILCAHLVALAIVHDGKRLGDIDWLSVGLVVLIVWSAGFAWEFARKIRSPEEENEYVTYSRLLGPRRAAVVAGLAQTTAFLIGLFLTLATPLSVLLPIVAGAGLAPALFAETRFIRKPSPQTSRLDRAAERYVILTLLALTAGSIGSPI